MNWKALYRLTKPGVLYGNVLTAAAGFLLASKGSIDWWLFLATIVGTTLVIAAACVLNNFLDQDIDSKMERTKKRPLIAGEVSGHGALIFCLILFISGFLILLLWANYLVVAIGLAGFVTYVWLYGALSKRRSVHGTLVGSVSGAAPILAGYCAVTNDIDVGAALLFTILFIWQMPEFYSIAIYRRSEYKKAGIPVISVVKGVEYTKVQIFLYLIAFTASVLLLTVAGYTGYTYLVVMSVLCAYWLWLGWKSFSAKDDNHWSRKVFHHSLIVLLAFSFLISVDSWLP